MSIADPLDALRRLGRNWRATRSEAVPPESALGLFLAEGIEVRAPEGAWPRSALNGYALPRGLAAGEHLLRPPSGDGEGEDGGEAAGPLLVRVESGEPLPPGCDRVVPVEWTAISVAAGGGLPRLRLEADAIPPAGYGVAEDGPLAVEAGTRIDPRLQAVLLAGGIAAVPVHPPRRVGILSLGRRLTGALGAPAPASTLHPDLNGAWIAASVRALGHWPAPLGIAGESLEEGRDALLRAQKKGLRHLIASGGAGDGVEDRTAELLQRAGARIAFERVAIRPGRRCLAGDWGDIKVIVVGGKPIDAAAAFDLFARPALLSALGAPSRWWDWSARRHPAEALSGVRAGSSRSSGWRAREERDGPSGRRLWTALPVRPGVHGEGFRPAPSGPAAVSPTSPQPFHPWIPEQRGWAIITPAALSPDPAGEAGGAEEPPPSGAFYYQDVSLEGGGLWMDGPTGSLRP